jgi:hypothetical protein
MLPVGFRWRASNATHGLHFFDLGAGDLLSTQISLLTLTGNYLIVSNDYVRVLGFEPCACFELNTVSVTQQYQCTGYRVCLDFSF